MAPRGPRVPHSAAAGRACARLLPLAGLGRRLDGAASRTARGPSRGPQAPLRAGGARIVARLSFGGHTGAGGRSGRLGPGTVGDEPRGCAAVGEDRARARSVSAGSGTGYVPAVPSESGSGTPLARAKRLGAKVRRVGLVDRFADQDARSRRPIAPAGLTSPSTGRVSEHRPTQALLRRRSPRS